MNRPLDTADDAEPGPSAAGRLWAFLNRDVSTFKWWGRKTATPDTQGLSDDRQSAPGALDQILPSEVDHSLIERLRFKRELLDWRDEFHVQITACAVRVEQVLSAQVDEELAAMSFLRRRLFTLPAAEVLADHIQSVVRTPLRNTVHAQQAALDGLVSKWFGDGQPAPKCSVLFPKLEWDTRLALKVSPGNSCNIKAALRELITGTSGIAADYRQWATNESDHLLRRHHAQPNSV